MKKLTLITAICAPLLLGGCNITVGQILSYKQTSLEFAKNAIRASCATIGNVEVEVTGTARNKVGQIRAAVTAICNNVDLLTDDIVGNYVAAVGRAVKDAKAAQASQ